MLVKKPNKRKQYGTESDVLVVDVMPLIRHIPLGQLSTFQDLLNAAWKRSKCDPIHLKDIEFDKRLPIQPE